jgi:hypothetical protein
MIKQTANVAFFADVRTQCMHGQHKATCELERAECDLETRAVRLADGQGGLGNGGYRARALPGAE